VDKNKNNMTRPKAHLYFMGNRQIKGLDVNETFEPMAKFITNRCILAMMAASRWNLHEMDIKTAFLNGELDKEVNMEQPDSYVDPTYPNKACRLLQALYGLGKAPKMWYVQLDNFLKSSGLDNIDSDACLYPLVVGCEINIILVYVDDLLLVASSLAAIYKFKKALHKGFEVKDLGEAKVILGLDIRRDKALGTLKLSSGKYPA